MNIFPARNFVVYRIKNTLNGRVYFGSSSEFDRRKLMHLKNMRGEGQGLPNYLRDIRRLGHQPEDFSFRVIARFDNQMDMLRCEQMFLNMYWGTISCYNTAHEVLDNWVKQTLVVWNMKTLETRQYLSCHAVRKDLAISKESIRKNIDREILHCDFWVVEPWSRRRTVADVIKDYKDCGVELPEFALNPKRKGSSTPIPGVCSLAELVYRRRFIALTAFRSRKRLRPNHEEQFWYG